MQLLCQAQQHLDRGRLDEAEASLLEAIDLNPDLRRHNNLGLVYFQRRQLYDAAHAFDQAILLMPGAGLPAA